MSRRYSIQFFSGSTVPWETNTEKQTLNGGAAILQIFRTARQNKYKTWRATPIMRLLAYLYLLCQSGALFTIPPVEQIYDVIITPLAATTEIAAAAAHTTFIQFERPLTFTRSTTRSSQSIPTTMAPLSRNALELRQKYMNDQGFGVDCGAWTKYQYTRVIPSDEATSGLSYERNNIPGSSNTYTSNGAGSIMPLAITYIVLMNVITLWAAMSLA